METNIPQPHSPLSSPPPLSQRAQPLCTAQNGPPAPPVRTCGQVAAPRPLLGRCRARTGVEAPLLSARADSERSLSGAKGHVSWLPPILRSSSVRTCGHSKARSLSSPSAPCSVFITLHPLCRA